jgi:hypothetical protein
MWQNIKAFFCGFDYAVKHYKTIEDKHFFTYFGDNKRSSIYRNGINTARKYVQYRNEILTLIILIFTLLLFMFTC